MPWIWHGIMPDSLFKKSSAENADPCSVNVVSMHFAAQRRASARPCALRLDHMMMLLVCTLMQVCFVCTSDQTPCCWHVCSAMCLDVPATDDQLM